MTYSINLNNFKKVAAVATFLTTMVCLVPESAQAVRLRFSGAPNDDKSTLVFILDTSILDAANDPNIGSFPGAIQNANYSCTTENSISVWCGGQPQILFNPGNLQASPRVPSDGVNNYQSFFGYNVGVKYEARLDSSSSSDFFIEFVILVKTSHFDIINSLSDLSSVFINNPSDVFVVISPLNSKNGNFTPAGNGSSFKVVPEPDATSSVLVAGAIGVLLLKRIRRSKKLTQSKLTLSE
ncbi:MAG TPA: hypothetical protein DCY88_14255 [Cyanobacteria bacterium UBA11372]|nr:hypothetical protein [Cyanobacteria bacterium UBA11372]